MPAISRINIYAVKSMRGVAVESALAEDRGLAGDRRWMVVDAEGAFVTQRELPRMALICPELVEDGLILSAPSMPDMRVRRPEPDTGPVRVRVWRSELDALPAEECVRDWLSSFLRGDWRLVYMPDNVRRPVNPDYAAGEGIVSFADGYPIMILGQASLDMLNRRLAVPVPMNRFRPSLVVTGADSHAEDDWREIRVGDVAIRLVKPCERCVMTTIDQCAGARSGEEPLRTLATYRARNQKVLFGMMSIPLTTGKISVGDEVHVLR